MGSFHLTMNTLLRRWLFLLLSAFGAAALVFSAAQATAQNYVWKNVVIKGGGFVSGIVFHPAEKNLLYVRTDVGGAFRWLPETSSWLPLNDDLGKDDSQLTGVLSLALDPNDANRVYLASGQYLPSWAQNGAILRSTDRGVTWSRSNLPIKLGGNSDGRSTGERLQVDPNLGSILFLGTNQDGLWKSTNAGQTWAKVSSFAPPSATLVVFDPRTGTSGNATQTIYVGVNSTSSASLYRSTDGGGTWAAVPGIPGGVLPHHAKLSADGTLYVTFNNSLGPNGVTAGSVWKLKTADGTWTNITPQPVGQGGFGGVALDAVNPGTLVVTTLDRWSPRDEIYRSVDGGATWKALNAVSTYDLSSAPYASASTPHWLGDIEIDPFDGNRAFYITGYGVFGTQTLQTADANGQVTWIFRNDGLEETVPLGLISPPSGAPLISTLGDIDGFRHDDLAVSPPQGRHLPRVGTSWSIDFAELAPSIIVKTHNSGTTPATRSVDGGTTWNYFASVPPTATSSRPGAIAVSADGATLVWAPTNAGLYFSTNNGGTWAASTGGPAVSTTSSYTPVADRVNAARFYVYDPVNGRVYASTNGGGSFALAATGLPTGGEPLQAVSGKEGHLWLTTWTGGLYRSTNFGALFSKVAGVQEAHRLGLGKAASGQTYPAIYLWGKIGGTNGFFRSDNEGLTWIRINDDAHQFGWINVVEGDPRVFGRVYLATGGRGIIYGELSDSVVAPTIAWSTPGAILAGTALTDAQLNATANVPGTFSFSPAAGTVLAVGTHTLTATFTPSDVTRYSATAAQVSLRVLAEGLSSTRLVNIATRAHCGVGDNVTIGGFVIGGTVGKRVLIRAVGPTLVTKGIGSAEVLMDPLIKVHHNGQVVAENDDWGQNSNAGEITSVATQIGADPLDPTDTRSCALLLTLDPGVYSFVASGKAGTSGIVLLEVYDADSINSGTRFVNIATRAFCATGNGVTIGGFVISGSGGKQILVRALGPTLTVHGISAAAVLADPQIDLYRGQTLIASNDDWNQELNATAIVATGARIGATPIAPTDTTSAGMLRTLEAGVYSFIVRGKGSASGIVLVEVYDAD